MKFFISFRQWAASFRLLVEFFDGDVRTAFYVSKTTFQRRRVFFLTLIFIFGHWAIFRPILAKKSSGVVKTGFSVSMETFGCKSFAKPTNCYFVEFRAEIVWLAVRKKSTALSSCFLPPHGNNLKKFFSKSFCIFCGLFSDHFR